MKSFIFKTVLLLAIAFELISSTYFTTFSIDDNIVIRSDLLYAHRIDEKNVWSAIAILEKSIKDDPGNYQILWRLARCYCYLANRGPKENKLSLFEQGKIFAAKATAADKNGYEGHYWLACLTGGVAQEKGAINSLALIRFMVQELEHCLILNPNYNDAHSVLAQIYWRAPGFPLSLGNKKKALEEALLATANNSQNTGHWLILGQIGYDNGDKVLAKNALQKVLALPNDPEEPDTSQNDKAIAGELLRKILSGK